MKIILLILLTINIAHGAEQSFQEREKCGIGNIFQNLDKDQSQTQQQNGYDFNEIGISKEQIYGFQDNKRNLQIPSCPANTLFFPVIIGGTDSDCNRAIVLSTFDSDSSGQTLVCGQVDTSSASSTCQAMTNSKVGLISFMGFLNSQGNYKWINLLENNATIPVKAAIISCSYIYTAPFSSTVLRFIRINAATGATEIEKSADSYLGGSNELKYLYLRTDQTTQDLYVQMKLKTTSYGYNDFEAMIMKLNSDLTVQWFQRVHGDISNPVYEALSLSVGQTTSNIWQISNFYVDSVTLNYAIQKIQKSDGNIISEQTFANDQQSDLFAIIRLNQNETMWYTAMYYSSSFALSLQTGTTSSNDLTKSYKTVDVYSYIDMSVQQTTGNFIILGLKGASYQICLAIVDYSTGAINKQVKIVKGSTGLMGSTSGGYVYFAFSQANLLSQAVNGRIIVFKSTDTLDFSKTSCLNTTTPSLAAFTDGGITSTTQAFPKYSQNAETFDLVSLASFSFVKQTQVTYPYYTMRDVYASQFCDLPLYLSQQVLTYDYNLYDGQNRSYGPLTVSDCTGTSYKMINILDATGSATPGVTILDPATQTIHFQQTSSADSFSTFGDKGHQVIVSTPYGNRAVYFKIRGIPQASYTRDQTIPNHDTSQCEDAIYPFFYGFNAEVNLNLFTMDEYGNLLMAGQAKRSPFGLGDSYNRGYLHMADQRGNPYWTYVFQYMPDTSKETNCNWIAQQSTFVYGMCFMPSELFPSLTQVLHFVKLKHQTGEVVYVKKAPTNNLDPVNQLGLGFYSLGSNKVLAFFKSKFSVPSGLGFTAGDYTHIQSIKFNEVTDQIDYFKSYVYDGSSSQYIDIQIDQTNDLFLECMTQGAQKGIIFQGKISDGSMKLKQNLNELGASNTYFMKTAFYKTSEIIFPITTAVTNKILRLHILDRITLAPVKTLQIQFTSNWDFSQGSTQVYSDSSQNIYVIASYKQIYFAKILANTFDISTQRYWTGSGDSVFVMNVRGVAMHDGNIFHAFQGRFNTAYATNGIMIFKNMGSQDNCFDIPELVSTNTDWYPTYDSSATTTLTTPSAMTDISIDAGTNTDNYPLIHEVYTYNTKSYTYATSNIYEWGASTITGFYQRYPNQEKLCGMISIPRKFITYNNQGTIQEFKWNTGDQNIDINTTITNCQGRPWAANVISPHTGTQTLHTSLQNVFSIPSATRVVASTNSATYPIAATFNVKYSDPQYPSVYFYEHALLVRIQTTNLTLKTSDIQMCAYTPFPFSFGQVGSNADQSFYYNSMTLSEVDQSMYVTGYSNVGNTWTIVQDGNDAFVMRISQTGAVDWYNQISLLKNQIESGHSVTLSNGYVYTPIYFLELSFDAPRIVNIVKLTQNEGLLVWSKKLIPRNLVDTTPLYIYSISDLTTFANNQSLIMASILYVWNNNSQTLPGNFMIYDNGTDLTSLYEYQIKPKVSQSYLSTCGQSVFDSDGEHVYITSTAQTLATSYRYFQIMKIKVITGDQVWSRIYNTDQPQVINQLLPIVNINKLTDSIYLAIQQTASANRNLQIIKINKDGGTLKRIQTQSSQYTYYTIDMVMNHYNGQVLILGVGGSGSNKYYSEIIAFDQDLNYVDGPYRLHNYNYISYGRLAYQVNDVFYLIYNSNQFNGYTGYQIVFQKKSVYIYETYKHECHGYFKHTGQSSYTSSQSLTLSNNTIPADMIRFTVEPLVFRPDIYTVNRQLGSYYTGGSLMQQLDSYENAFQSGTSSYCTGFTASQPVFPELDPIEVNTGNVVSVFISVDSFKQCQGLPITMGTFNYEADNSTQIKTFLSISSLNATHRNITVDARQVAPNPGQRWFTASVTTSQRSRTIKVLIPVIVWPSVKPKAPKVPQEDLCPDNDQIFPKLLTHPSISLSLWGSDLDTYNGNMLMCGASGGQALYVQEYIASVANSYIALMDSNGKYQWGLAGVMVSNPVDSLYTSCMFGSNQTGIYGTIMITNPTLTSAASLVLVKHDYETGIIKFIRQIQGNYFQKFQQIQMQIDRTNNHIYIAGNRTDLYSSISVGMNQHYVARIDVSQISPVQNYFIYGTYSSPYDMYNVEQLFVSQTLDYFLTYGRLYYSSSFYYVVTKFQKTTGRRLATRSFLFSVHTSDYVKMGLIGDESNIFVGYVSYSPWNLYIRKMDINTMSVIDGRDLSGVQYSNNYYGYATLALDDTFLYVYFNGLDQQYKFIGKLNKSNMNVILTAYMGDKVATGSLYQNMIIYNNMLYVFYHSTYYYNQNLAGIVNQMSTMFESPRSCIEWILYTPTLNQQSLTPSYDSSSIITFTVNYGDVKYIGFPGYAFEYWDSDRMRSYDSEYFQCQGQAPKFSDALKDQIIQLPITDPVTYTFEMPTGCFSSNVDLSWSVDRYSASEISSFFQMSKTSTHATFTMSPTAANIGTYVVRVTFKLQNTPTISSFSTFVVEVYPQTSYGFNNPNITCPSSLIPATFMQNSALHEWHMADMDSQGQNFVLCGKTKVSTLSKNPSYQTGFIQSFTTGLNLNFHLSVETAYNTNICYVQYGMNDSIYSAFHFALVNGNFDTIALIQHNNYGMYQQSRMIKQQNKQIQLHDYKVDLSNGDQYISGGHYNSYMSRRFNQWESFICRLDKNYDLTFFTTYQYSTSQLMGKELAFESGSSNQLFQLIRYNPNYYNFGIQKISKIDGSQTWSRGLQDSSNYGRQDQIIDYQNSGLIYTKNYLYTAFPYVSSGTASGYELYVIKIDPTTGSIVQSLELNITQAQTVNMAKTSTENYIVVTYTTTYYVYLFVLDISGSSFTYTSYGLTISESSSYIFRRSYLFERNQMMWGFAQNTYTSSYYYAYLYKFKDYTNVQWDLPCNIQGRTPYFYSDRGAPLGINSQYVSASNWYNLGSQISSWTIPSDLFYRWYGPLEQIRILPYNNASASQREQRGNCAIVANPSSPVVQNRTGDPIDSNTGGFSVSSTNYSILLPVFPQCSGEAVTLSVKYSNGTLLGTGFIRFDPATGILSIAPSMNSFIGVYTLTYTAKLTAYSNTNQTNFQIEVVGNKAPTAKINFLDPVTIFAHHNYQWTVQYDTDFEGDLATFSVEIVSDTYTALNSSQSYLYVNKSDDTGIEFTVIDPPQPSTELRYVQVKVWDEFNVATPSIYNISLTVQPNKAPYMSDSLNLDIPDIFITRSFKYTIWYQNFTDDEGDNVIINCVKWTDPLDANWINIDVNSSSSNGNITFYGKTPRNNDYAGNYEIKCTVKDQWDGTPNEYTFKLKVIAKDPIELAGTFDSLYVRLPDTISENYASASVDPLNEPNFYSLYINETLYDSTVYSSWLKWDNVTLDIICSPFSNSQGGNHSLSIRFDDFITPPQYINITLEVQQNWPLKIIETLPNINGIVNNWFFFDYNKSEIFENPEGQPFTMYFRMKDNENSLPYFVTKNFSNGTIGGFTTDIDIGTYSMECVGIDDAYWETVIQFSLIIKPCYYKCYRCWDSEYNTCTQCKPGFYLLNSECLDICPMGTYHDIINWKCLTCPIMCKTCSGPDTTTQCQSCNPGYYKLNNGCYESCPDSFWGDKTDYNCKKCNTACSRCFGSSSTQCYNCTELQGENEIGQQSKLGYLLQGTECRIPKCIEGQYFKWNLLPINGILTGSCEKCNSRCRRCTGPLETDCAQCYPGAILNTQNHTCTFCEEITGYFTNEEFECEEVCGDGILIQKQCDDGNVISGDGCSNKCVLEYGFGCPVPNKTCNEIIPPFFKITTITPKNQIYVEFSEPILIQNEGDIGPENMIVDIIGPKGSYTYEWRLIVDPRNPILPNRYITKFSLILTDFKQSIEGTEIVRISFRNYSTITDLVGNQLTPNQFTQINPYPFIYLSESEANTAQGGGTSLKYTFMSVFSFNLGLKVVMNSSMNYLWGLVHALQVFNFLLYLNIDFPDNVMLFSNYLKIASGDIEELNQYIPNIADCAIHQEKFEDPSDNDKLPPKFQDDDVSPYFVIAFGQKLTLWCMGLLVVLPIILILNKLCKKVRLWEDIKGSFFFNGPLRAFIEMYIELIIQVIINTQFVKFKNFDAMMATSIAFVFGAISMLLPFLAMTLIYHNRKKINSKKWKMSFGMLTEECDHKSILQLYYYPLFMYQRLIIAGIIVYVYETPLLQCLLVIACNLLMIAYLIIVRPFKEESQQTTTVLDEFVIMICVILFIVILKKEMTQDEKKDMGWGIIIIILFSVCKNFGVVIYIGVIQARQKLYKLFQAEDNEKDSPHTSDNEDYNQDSDEDFDTLELQDEIMKEKRKREWNPIFHDQPSPQQQLQQNTKTNNNNSFMDSIINKTNIETQRRLITNTKTFNNITAIDATQLQ